MAAWMVVARGKSARAQKSSARSTVARMRASMRAPRCSGLPHRHVCWLAAAHLSEGEGGGEG